MITLLTSPPPSLPPSHLSTAFETGSTPRLCAGGPSMTILMNSIIIAFIGFGIPLIVASIPSPRAPTLVESWKTRNARML